MANPFCRKVRCLALTNPPVTKRSTQDEDQGVPQVTRSAQTRRDAFRASEDASSFRAAAPARPLGCPRRVPPCGHRAEPQDAGSAPHPAATPARLCVSCVASAGGVSVEADPHRDEARSLNQPQDLPHQPGRHPAVLADDFFDNIDPYRPWTGP
jgi:hypothetical protein